MKTQQNHLIGLLKSVAVLLLALAIFTGVAAVVFAQENYLYVNTEENLKMVAADTPTEAIDKPADIKSNSGVILSASYEALSQGSVLGVSDTMEPIVVNVQTSSSQELYAFVNTDGEMDYINSEDPMKAIEDAENIKSDSGVMLVVE